MKFKAWDKINEKWIDTFRMLLANDGEVIEIEAKDGKRYRLYQFDLVMEQSEKLPDKDHPWHGFIEVDGKIYVSSSSDKIYKSEDGWAGPWEELVDEEQPVEKSGGWIK